MANHGYLWFMKNGGLTIKTRDLADLTLKNGGSTIKHQGCDGNIRGISWGRNGIQVTAWDCWMRLNK